MTGEPVGERVAPAAAGLVRAEKRRQSKSTRRTAADRLIPPPGTAVVRFYRIGHGDCFLLALPGTTPDEPVYVLIDCGYKPGSPKLINDEGGNRPADIVRSIKAATGDRLDVVVITHEHQDHVNAITETNFSGFEIGEAWFAWTEDPSDAMAKQLRQRFKDRLLGLMKARDSLTLSLDETHKASARKIDTLLTLELGGEDDLVMPFERSMGFAAAEKAFENSANKKAMKLVKDRATKGVRYLRPHEPVRLVPGCTDVRVFVLGPPQDEQKISDLDPTASEEFHLAALSAAEPIAEGNGSVLSPFDVRYLVTPTTLSSLPPQSVNFFEAHYGAEPAHQGHSEPLPVWPLPLPKESSDFSRSDVTADNASWRRIESDWLMAAEELALDMNTQTNNGSLVLAFELGRGGKVLLFAADAQRGNWVSWSDAKWKDGNEEVTLRDLLSRTVLLKVGHHGSHNATLNGTRESSEPNLNWMATGSEAAREFTVMITAVREWAETQNGWDHPFPPIKAALLGKSSHRLLQTDTERAAMVAPETPGQEWTAFQDRLDDNPLFFDYTVTVR